MCAMCVRVWENVCYVHAGADFKLPFIWPSKVAVPLIQSIGLKFGRSQNLKLVIKPTDGAITIFANLGSHLFKRSQPSFLIIGVQDYKTK